jgi:hypothetical protein
MLKRSYLSVLILGVLFSGCQLLKPQVATVEVTRVVRETQVVTLEVTRVVTATAAATLEESFDPNQWQILLTEGATLSLPRAHHTATVMQDGRVLIAGGTRNPDEHLNDTEILDPASGTITISAPLLTPRHDFTATALLDGRVLVVGGYNARDGWLDDAEIYDPETDSWSSAPPIFPHGVHHSATRLQDGRVLVVGGCIGSGVCTEKTEIFDPAMDAWIETAPLETERASQAAVLLKDGRVLLVGGDNGSGDPGLGDALLYDAVTDTWMPTTEMTQQRIFPQVALLKDGRVLAAGGANIDSSALALRSTEIYDPAADAWIAAAPMTQPRYAFALQALPGGQVIAVGGTRTYGSFQDAGSFIGEIELYNLEEDRWYVAASLPQPEAFIAAVLLPDSRLWITGGQSGQNAAIFWADTWLIEAFPPY